MEENDEREAGIRWDKVVENVWKDIIGGNKKEILSIEDVGKYKTKVGDMIELRERKSLRQRANEEEPQNLSEVARMTRRVFREAIAKRVVGERYRRKESQHSHLSGMAMLMVPRLRSGKYLNLIRDSDVGKIGGFTQTADLI